MIKSHTKSNKYPETKATYGIGICHFNPNRKKDPENLIDIQKVFLSIEFFAQSVENF
jgi:hypothetical protein